MDRRSRGCRESIRHLVEVIYAMYTMVDNAAAMLNKV
jgi:hypothetical protein